MDQDEWYVMPKSQWNDARTHHPAEAATRDEPAALCNEITERATLRIASPADRDRYGLCRVCDAIASETSDPRGNHGQSGRSPRDVLRDCGFDTEADSLEADHV
jgi:hypothetical protein